MNYSQFKQSPLAASVATILSAGLLFQPANAATRTWDGNGANNNWSYVDPLAGVFGIAGNTNWTDAAPSSIPISGESLIFQGSARLTPYNDLISHGVSGITFAEGAGAFTLNGNIVSSTGNITNLSGKTQTINMQLYVSGDQTWDGAADTGGTGWLNVNKLQMGNATLTLQRNVTISNLISDFIVGYADQSTLIVKGGSTINSVNGIVGNATKGTVTIDGNGSKWTNNSELSIGYQGNGSVNVNNGGMLTNAQGWIGYGAGSVGAATVDGVGSNWNNSLDLVVGFGGNGVLNIQNGGVVNNNDGFIGYSSSSLGDATVDGVGSTWNNSKDLLVGTVGGGRLNIENGGTVNNSLGVIGYAANKVGRVFVDGLGSTWRNTQDLHVGEDGIGGVYVTRAGALINQQGWIGYGAGSLGVAIVNGLGSTWQNSKDLVVGASGNGTLNVQNRGVVENVYGTIAHGTGSVGNASVSGEGASWINREDLFVGENGNGSLSIQNRGTVNNKQGFIGYYADGLGEAKVGGKGSTWNNSASLVIGNIGNGKLFVTNGGTVNSLRGVIGFIEGSVGEATVQGDGATWNNSQDLMIGDKAQGKLLVDAGGKVISQSATIGDKLDSIGEVSVYGIGTSWTNSGDLVVGNDGEGLLNIGAGGIVTSNNAQLSPGLGSSKVRIGGVGSTWQIRNNLQLGGFGSSLVELETDGSLNVGGNIDFIGMLNILGGSLSAQTINKQFQGTFNWSSGEVSLARAAIGSDEDVFSGYAYIDTYKTLTIRDKIDILDAGIVTVTNTGKFNANNIDNQGILNIGATGQLDATSLVNTGTIINRGSLHSTTLTNGATIQLAGTGSISADQLNLDHGSITGSSLNVGNIGLLSGSGSVTASVVGGAAANTIQASAGNLDLGNSNSNNGFNFGGKLDVGANQVNLLDKDKADLGVSTSIAEGGKLSAVNGADLSAGETLNYTGNASILGNFTNNGEVAGSGGVLTFLNDVNGAGGFNGDVAFHGDYSPGNSPASINFHDRDISFNATSVLTMEIFGDEPGIEYDQLVNIDHLNFNGTLALVFGGNFTPTSGNSYNLFDFTSFSGSFASDRITVTGLDRALLDLSTLAVDGRFRVAAVPLPTATWLFFSGLMATLTVNRRRKTAGSLI